jgi:hypothetical protein
LCSIWLPLYNKVSVKITSAFLRLMRHRNSSTSTRILDLLTVLYLCVPVFVVLFMVVLKIVFVTNIVVSNPYTRLNIWKDLSNFLYKAYLFSCPLPLFIWLLNTKRKSQDLLHVYAALIFGFFFETFSYNIAQIIIDLTYLILSLFSISSKTNSQ